MFADPGTRGPRAVVEDAAFFIHADKPQAWTIRRVGSFQLFQALP
jgi:hypothetical protein